TRSRPGSRGPPSVNHFTNVGPSVKSTPGPASRSDTPGCPPYSSTPKSLADDNISHSVSTPSTPRLPSRQSNPSSGPTLPPRSRREVNTPTSLDFSSPSGHGTPPPIPPPSQNNRPPAPPPKPSKNITSPSHDKDDVVSITSAGGSKERRVANSVWYEYGCV
ncbi:hypothetical protein FHG87_020865, partial [Trinorchestia longiramus]